MRLFGGNPKKKGIVIYFCLFFSLNPILSRAQSKQDTLSVVEMKSKSPTGALIRSAFLPGLGQCYNRQYIKAMLVFGIELGFAANAVYQNQMAVRSDDAYSQDFYASNRSESIWWFFGIYLLNILDAYVDAHLWDFDTGPDLSINRISQRHYSFFTLHWQF